MALTLVIVGTVLLLYLVGSLIYKHHQGAALNAAMDEMDAVCQAAETKLREVEDLLEPARLEQAIQHLGYAKGRLCRAEICLTSGDPDYGLKAVRQARLDLETVFGLCLTDDELHDLCQAAWEEAIGGFRPQNVGVIEGGDGSPVEIVGMTFSPYAARDYVLKKYGLEPSQPTLLCDYVPAGMTYDRSDPTKIPQEDGVDSQALPPPEQWVTFPKELKIKGIVVPVVYARGHMAFAL